jgi:hypothetical protein
MEDYGEREGVKDAASAAMMTLLWRKVPVVGVVAVAVAAAIQLTGLPFHPAPAYELSVPVMERGEEARWPCGTRPGFFEAWGGGSEEGARKRRSPSRSSSHADVVEERVGDDDGGEKRSRKGSAGGERRGRAASMGSTDERS